jgi:hypothetical protein
VVHPCPCPTVGQTYTRDQPRSPRMSAPPGGGLWIIAQRCRLRLTIFLIGASERSNRASARDTATRKGCRCLREESNLPILRQFGEGLDRLRVHRHHVVLSKSRQPSNTRCVSDWSRPTRCENGGSRTYSHPCDAIEQAGRRLTIVHDKTTRANTSGIATSNTPPRSRTISSTWR